MSTVFNTTGSPVVASSGRTVAPYSHADVDDADTRIAAAIDRGDLVTVDEAVGEAPSPAPPKPPKTPAPPATPTTQE